MADAYLKYDSFKQRLKRFVPKGILSHGINAFHLLEAVVASLRYGFPARSMKFVGVTGTNGKTTTCLMTATILEQAGYKVGLSSSAFIKTGGKVSLNTLPGRLTNANPWILQKLLRDMKRQGVEWVVLESASHALHQHRLWGIRFQAAILTNVTEDHLDYHGTMENYAAAKAMLFKRSPLSVINADDDRADYFRSVSRKTTVTYGKAKSADYTLQKVTLKPTGTVIELSVNGKPVRLNLKLVGEFNAYNAAAALAATHELGVDLDSIKTALESLERVPGRLDKVEAGQAYTVLIDDAHTPDAIQNVLEAARAITSGRLVIITGAAGERPSSRRGPVAKIASHLSDIFIITDDEPHHEDPDNVLRELEQGATGKAKVMIIKDRCEAMREAFRLGKKGDTIVIAGMGYKHHRDGPRGQEPWDDRAVAHDILKGKTSKFDTNWRTVMHEAWPDKR